MSRPALYQEGSRSYAKPSNVDSIVLADITNNIRNNIRNDIKKQQSFNDTIRILNETSNILRPYELVAEWLAETVPLKVGLNAVPKSFPYSKRIGGKQTLLKTLSRTFPLLVATWKRSC